MAVTDMSFRQRAVTEFLVKEGNSAGVNYERLSATNDKARNGITPHRPKKKKPKIAPSFGIVEGCILVDFLEKGEMIIANRYVQTFSKLRRELRGKRPKKKTVILQHDKVRPHTARLTLQTIQKNG
jgi:hypothetical protein